MIRFECECGRQLQARDELAGRTATCPGCGQPVPIPDPDRPEAAPARRERAAVQAERPRDADPDDRPRRRRDEEDEGRPAPAGTSGKATASLVLGIASNVCLMHLLTGVPAIILGLMALGDVKRSRGRLGGKGLAIGGIVTGVVGVVVVLPAVVVATVLLVTGGISKVREAAGKAQSHNNLKQMALAVHQYHDRNTDFPPAGQARDRAGRPQLSWRVHVLQYLGKDEQALYKRFNLNEPWDGPTNKPLIGQMPKVFEVPNRPAGSGMTYYRVFVSPPGHVFPPGGGRPAFHEGSRLNNFTDGTSNTLLIVESSKAVIWTQPDIEIRYVPGVPFGQLDLPKDGFNAAMADGSTRFIPANTPEASIRALITADGGEVVVIPP